MNASANVTNSTVSTFLQDRQVEQYQPFEDADPRVVEQGGHGRQLIRLLG